MERDAPNVSKIASDHSIQRKVQIYIFNDIQLFFENSWYCPLDFLHIEWFTVNT